MPTGAGHQSDAPTAESTRRSVCLTLIYIRVRVWHVAVGLSLMLCPQSKFIVPECGRQPQQLALIAQVAKRWEPWACCCYCGSLQLHKNLPHLAMLFVFVFTYTYLFCVLLHVCVAILVCPFSLACMSIAKQQQYQWRRKNKKQTPTTSHWLQWVQSTSQQ